MPLPVLALEPMTCCVIVSIVNSWVGEFTIPLVVPVPVRTAEPALECMESTLLVKTESRCQSV